MKSPTPSRSYGDRRSTHCSGVPTIHSAASCASSTPSAAARSRGRSSASASSSPRIARKTAACGWRPGPARRRRSGGRARPACAGTLLGHEERVPAVRVLGDDTQRSPLARAPDPERQCPGAASARSGLAELVVLAFERRALARSRDRGRMAASSSMSIRCPIGGKAIPYWSCSSSYHAARGRTRAGRRRCGRSSPPCSRARPGGGGDPDEIIPSAAGSCAPPSPRGGSSPRSTARSGRSDREEVVEGGGPVEAERLRVRHSSR